METLWAEGTVQDVYYRMGNGLSAKYWSAPFQLWKTNDGTGPKQYIISKPAGSRVEAIGQLASGDEDEKRMWRYNWDFLEPEPFRISESALGNWMGDSETWMGVHKFSRV
jgi:hypothetical protein